MVRLGIGVTVIARQCVSALLSTQEVFELEPLISKPAQSPIYLATLARLQQPRRVQKVMETFQSMKS